VGHETIFVALKEQQMNMTIALFKKEIHTAKWFLLGGILFFWSFPLLQLAGNYYQWGKLQADMPSAMAIVFGGLFAIITAAGLVCLDMSRGLYDFWRSKPIRLMPHMLVKYAVGLAIVLFAITVPVWLEIVLSEYDGQDIAQRTVLYCHTFIIVLIYSIAFCIGHLLRNMTESVVISCTAALLIYFVPVLVPALESLSFFNILFLRPPASFYELLVRDEFINLRILVGMTIILSAGLFYTARIFLEHHIQIRLGLQSLCWSLGIIMLVLFSAAAFSVGSNLNCLAKVSFPSVGQRMSFISSCFDDKSGVVLGGRYDKSTSSGFRSLQIDRFSEEPSYTYRHESYLLDDVSLSPQDFSNGNGNCGIAWSKQVSDIVYLLRLKESAQANEVPWRATLYIIKLDDSTHTAQLLKELPVGEYDAEKLKYYRRDIVLDYPTLYLFLPGEAVIFDINNDKQPRLLAKSMYWPLYQGKDNGKEAWITIPLPTDNALSEEQRYRIAQYFSRKFSDWEGNRYVRTGRDFIRVFEKKETCPDKIRLVQIAERKSLPLEKLLEYYPRKTILRGDMVYLLYANDSVTVYQLNESSGTLKNIGHYASPEGKFYDMFLREDGNIALVGTNQIHIVQPPPARP
jgi:hypothetical protein